MLESLSGFFLDPGKLLFSLGFIIPLILLYLIRPRPQNVAVPSLMFILKDMGKSNVHRFFRTLFQDILFLLQLIAILLLALSLAKPFIEVEQETLVQQHILIIDVSASTAAGDRFDDIISAAEDRLADDNILILSRVNPDAVQQGGSEHLSTGDAKDILDDLTPSDMPGDLPSALTLAEQYAGPESKVTIITDMVLSGLESPKLIEAKAKVLRSKGALVEVVSIPAEGENIGIVDAQLSTQNATITLTIQNFNPSPEEIGLEYNGDEVALPSTLLTPVGQPGSFISVTIPLGNGKSEIVLSPRDDFMTDNTYYVSIPDKEYINILLINNDAAIDSSKLPAALGAAGNEFTKVGLHYGTPPKVPDLEHDIYIVKDVSNQFLLPGVISDLGERVEAGAFLVVFAQPDLMSIDFRGLLPVEGKPQAAPLSGRQELIVNDSFALMRGLSDLGQVDGGQLLRVSPTADAIVYASVATSDGPEPVIAGRRLGKGAVIYYGIRDTKGVDIDPQSYAILWGRMVDFALRNPMDLNVPTGAAIRSPSGKVQTPTGKEASPVLAADAGFYETSDLVLAANLYGLQASVGSLAAGSTSGESAINAPAQLDIEGLTGDTGDGTQTKVPWDLSVPAIIIGLIALGIELLYVKYRGDL